LVNVAVTFFQNVGSKIFYKEMLVIFFWQNVDPTFYKKMFVQYFLKNVATFFNVPSSSRRGGKNMRN
jgi:hypothetical protein